jgi:hypothetical protein
MNSVGGMNDLRGDFVWLHGSRRVAESAEKNKPNGGRHSTENSEEPEELTQVVVFALVVCVFTNFFYFFLPLFTFIHLY